MTSKITKKSYNEIISYNYNRGHSVYLIRQFYISGKQGTAFITHNHDKTFDFKWKRNIVNEYTNRCVNFGKTNLNNYFLFSSMQELNKKLTEQYVCQYHSFCPDSCPATRLISPTERCAICLVDVQMHLLEETPCGHRFCLTCLDTYVKSKLEPSDYGCFAIKEGYNLDCPTCRKNIENCCNCSKARCQCECQS